MKLDPRRVAGWRQSKRASIAQTATHFGISRRTVTNYCRDYGAEAQEARRLWPINKMLEQYDREIAEGERWLEIFKARYGFIP